MIILSPNDSRSVTVLTLSNSSDHACLRALKIIHAIVEFILYPIRQFWLLILSFKQVFEEGAIFQLRVHNRDGWPYPRPSLCSVREF